MARVLLVDGDTSRRVALAGALSAHDVEIAASAATGTYLARMSLPDLVIIDAVLPDGTSAEVCTALRRDSATARALLLVISPSTDEADRVAAFEAGADDYVVRPYSAREVVLRIRALLRRTRSRTPDQRIAVGPVRVDRWTRRVSVDGTNVPLTRREFDLLIRLIDGRGRVLGRDTIVADVWPDENPSQRVVDTTLKRLRKKLPAVGDRIRTIRGVGYELTTDEQDAET